MPGLRLQTAGLTAVALLTGAPPVLAAPVITTDRPCYSQYTPLRISGSGFTPGASVQLSETWVNPHGGNQVGPVLTATADTAGTFTYAQRLPRIDVDQLQLVVAATDQTLAAQGAPPSEQTATATVTVSFFGAYFRPWNTEGVARGRPGRRARLDVGGYIDSNSRTLYLHYVRRDRLVKTLRIGRLSGPCGTLTTRLREFAFHPVAPGTYRTVFDTTRTWPNADMWSGYSRVAVGRRVG